MTTPDPPDELGPVVNQLPRANETPVAPSMASSTPGVALAGARVPGAPTLPDWDPVALTTLLGRMANEMFHAQPMLPTSDDVAAPGAPAAALSSPGVSPMSSPAALGMPSGSLAMAQAYAPTSSPSTSSGHAPAASPSTSSGHAPAPPNTSPGHARASSPSTSPGYSSSSPSASSRPAASPSMPSSGSSPAMSTVLPDTSVSTTPPSPTVMSTTVPVTYPSTTTAPSPGGAPQRPPHVPGAPSPAYPPPPVTPSTPAYGAPAAPAQLTTPPAHTPPTGVPTQVPTAATTRGAAQPAPSTSPFDAPLDWSVLTAASDPYEHRDLPLALLDFDAPASPPSAAPVGSPVGSSAATRGSSAAPIGSPAAPIGSSAAPAGRIELPTYQPVPMHESSIRPLGNKPFDPYAIKREFPILDEPVRGKRLVWLDNAATTQKPRAVIDRLSYFYEHENSNIHRAAHTLAARATDAYESARESVRRFIHAPSTKEIVFVRGTTEGINFIAKSWGARNVRAGDEIVISWLEHHANIVPWQQLCELTGARLKVAPVDSTGQVILEAYERLLGPKTKLVSFTQVSNALGTVTPAREMIEMAHRHGAVVVLDGAQSVSHMPVDVMTLGCDFFVFSGHKVFGPTGIGAVFGRTELLEAMPPWQGGGNMIQDVTFEKTVYQGAPARFEAGTGNIADAVGLGAALDWLAKIGVENVGRYEHELLEYGTALLSEVPGLTLVGTAPGKAGVMSFVLDGHNTTDVGGLLDQEGIAVRSGHHCAQPILRRFGYEATVRASLAPYNTFEDLDALAAALHRLQAGHVSR